MNLRSLLCLSADLQARIEEQRESLFRVACAWSHDRALAEDLAQETLARAFERAHQLREPARLRGWLFGILTNCWRDHLRALRPTVDIDALDEEALPSHDDTPDVGCLRSETVALVRAAVGRLPVGQRQVLTLVDLEEFSYAEVAAILEIPIGTVMSRLCRARLALCEQLRQPDAVQPRLRSAK